MLINAALFNLNMQGDKLMSELGKKLMSFIRDEEGLTVVEYATAGGLITLAVVAAFQALGLTVAGVITNIDTALGG